MVDIVEAAGVTKPTFYNHYAGKGDLAYVVATDALRRYDELLDKRFEDMRARKYPLLYLQGAAADVKDIMRALVLLGGFPLGNTTVGGDMRAILERHYRSYVESRGKAADDLDFQAHMYSAMALSYLEYAEKSGELLSVDRMRLNIAQLLGALTDINEGV